MVRASRRFAGAGLIAGVLAVAGVAASNGAPADPQQSQSQGQPQQAQPAQKPDQAQKPDPAQQPTFRAGISFVRVDVIVSDKQGGPVGDLKETDFDISEDGKPQKIETFKLVKLDGGAAVGPDGPPKAIRSDYDEESEAARDDVRLFAVFLDDYHVRRGTSMSVREPLARFVENQLGPSDMIGLMYPLESTASVRMTRNHEAVAKGLRQFLGRKFEYEPRNEFEEKYANYPTETVERIRNEVSLSAIKGLIIHMGSLKEGRKALLLVSEGYTYMVPPQLRNPIATMPGVGNPQAGNPMAGENNINEDRAQFSADSMMQTDLREIYDLANKNNVAIYAVDPRGLAVGEFDIDQNVNMRTSQQYLTSTMDTLRVLSDQTDGRAIVNRNDLDGALKQVIRDSSAYYLIGYNSSQAPSDGKFHEIKVRVKRPGVQVRARKGYWAVTGEDVARATTPKKPGAPSEVQAALAPVNEPSHVRVVRTWIGTSRGENGKTRVTFVWEPTPKSPADSGRREEPQRVSLMAVGDSGAAYFRGPVPAIALASASSAPSAAGASAGTPPHGSRVTFDAAPGKMQLKMSVEGAGSQVLDSEVREITVPDLTSPQTTLGTPEVFRARTPREMQQAKTDADALPTVAREFSRTDRLLIRVPAYGPGGTAPALKARLLNRLGQPMSDLQIGAASAGDNAQQVELPLASLPVGEYVVEIKASDEGGDAQQLVGFRVTG